VTPSSEAISVKLARFNKEEVSTND